MKPASLLVLGVLGLAAPGCGGQAAAADAAAAAFAAFQQAMQQGDRALARSLLTSESAVALEQVDWAAVAGREPLQVLGAQRLGPEWWVEVADPAEGGRRSRFVVVREGGRLVVDLVASAAHNASYTASQRPAELEPKSLSPEEVEAAQRRWAARKPR